MEEKDNKKTKKENKEDTTKYGEFVSSFFTWNTLSKQKEIANKLEKVTKDKK